MPLTRKRSQTVDVGVEARKVRKRSNKEKESASPQTNVDDATKTSKRRCRSVDPKSTKATKRTLTDVKKTKEAANDNKVQIKTKGKSKLPKVAKHANDGEVRNSVGDKCIDSSPKTDSICPSDSIQDDPDTSKTNHSSLTNVDSLNSFPSKSSDYTSKETEHDAECIKEISSEDSSESEWEDVKDAEDEEREPVIPKDGVEITLPSSNIFDRRKKKKAFDVKDFLRMQVNRFKKETQVNLHKVHLLCLLARGLYVNNISSDDTFKGLTLSLMPSEFLSQGTKRTNIIIPKIISWYSKNWKLSPKTNDENVPFFDELISSFEIREFKGHEQYVLACVIFLRNFGFDVRLVISFRPTSFKPKDLIKKTSKQSSGSESDSIKAKKSPNKRSSGKLKSNKSVDEIPKKCKSSKNKPKGSLKLPTKTETHSTDNVKISRQCVKKPIIEVEEIEDDDEDSCTVKSKTQIAAKTSTEEWSSDDDFEVKVVRVNNNLKNNRKIKSEDEDEVETKNQHSGINFWIEVYSDTEKRWICIDCISNEIDCVVKMEAQSGEAFSYVVALDNNNNVKDVTRRYAEDWSTQTRKLRVEDDWWEETLNPFRGPKTNRDTEEDSALQTQLLERPLPSTIGEYKNHELYVLRRHLLKFEAIHPPDAPPVGFIRGEPVYARECVKTLHSRETWLKEARMIRIGEQPYKIVKARPKRNKWTGEMESNLPLEVYGIWQTEEYIPPIAANGKVPRNEYGNVELFKPTMLPIGTVLLQVPGLNRVARKLGIDCAPAMVGWDYHSGGSHPIFDGWVVCEEYRDTLMDAWHEQQKITEQRDKEKREKRVYGNWRRLIKGLLIRERLKARYNTEET